MPISKPINLLPNRVTELLFNYAKNSEYSISWPQSNPFCTCKCVAYNTIRFYNRSSHKEDMGYVHFSIKWLQAIEYYWLKECKL